MNLTKIIKDVMKEQDVEQFNSLIPELEKEIEPLLVAKAKKLITKRRLVQMFKKSLKIPPKPNSITIYVP